MRRTRDEARPAAREPAATLEPCVQRIGGESAL
jgi:hypothetical protein